MSFSIALSWKTISQHIAYMVELLNLANIATFSFKNLGCTTGKTSAHAFCSILLIHAFPLVSMFYW